MSAREGRDSAPGLALLTSLLNNHLDPGYAEAAARRADGAGGPPPGPRRRVGTALVLLLVGVVLAVAFEQTRARAPDSARTQAALAKDVRDRSAESDELQRRAGELREQVAEDRAAALAGSSTGDQAADRLSSLERVTGLSKVAGPGVVVTVGDGPQPADPVTGEPTDGPYLGRIQDRDLQDLVNALWRSGAEAVSVDGQRLTPTSAIRSAGEAVLVDFRPVSSPYEVKALGDPRRLASGFADTPAVKRFRAYVQLYGVSFDVARSDRLTLPPATAPELRYAKPSTAPTGTPAPASTRSGTSPASPRVPAGSPGADGRSGTPTPVPSTSGGGR